MTDEHVIALKLVWNDEDDIERTAIVIGSNDTLVNLRRSLQYKASLTTLRSFGTETKKALVEGCNALTIAAEALACALTCEE